MVKWLLMASIAVVSAAGSFLAVRTWLVPLRAADLESATLDMAADPETTATQALVSGRLSIVTDPPGARVSVDGRPRGVSPLVLDDLAPARHIIAVSAEAGSARQTVTTDSGVVKEVVFSLRGSAAPGAGWLAITSPFPVDVVEHDQLVGTSGAPKIMLPAGRHELLLRNTVVGYEALRTLDVKSGAVAAVKVTAPKARLNVNAQPWADVLIDGRPVGQTPLANVEIPAGAHDITFRHPQLGSRTERIVVKTHGLNRVGVDLNTRDAGEAR